MALRRLAIHASPAFQYPAARTLARRARAALVTQRWLLVPLAVAAGSRVVVLLVGYLSESVLPDNPRFLRATYSTHRFLDVWYEWDASWYSAVAVNGYQPTGPTAPGVAFWPLLPVLEWTLSRWLQWPLFGLALTEAIAWAGILLVSLAFVVSCALLYRLVLEDYSPDVARRTVTFLAFAPGAVYYTAPYPAALLLVGVVGCLWALRRERWVLAGMAGCWAAVAQVPGCLLVFPFAWEYLRRRRGHIGFSALSILLVPLGPALWLSYLWTLTGDPLAPVTVATTHWPHQVAWPWETLAHHALIVLVKPNRYALDWVNLGMTLGVLAASVWALRAGQASWGIWGLAVLVLYLSVPASEPFEGFVRYLLPVTPTWLLLAHLARHPLVEGILLGLLAALLGLLTAFYVNGFWVA
ncbi:MAG: hypothetical protein HY329_01670 [Chloroflexi bacterium]|nr:hypothetical protein [Chloroflexota bacterium]